MTRKKLQALKFKATQHLIYGTIMAILGTIPVRFQWGNGNHTGSLFLWILAGIVIYDSIKKLVKLNRIG